MKLIDISVPLDASLPTYPGNVTFSLDDMVCLPLRVVGGDCAPARVVLRGS